MRVGVIGPVGLDRVAENVGDGLKRIGHVPTLLGPVRSRTGGRLASRITTLTRHALPRLDEAMQYQIVRRARDADARSSSTSICT